MLAAGMLGAVAGYGVVDLLCDGSCAVWLVGGAMLAALIASFGAAILAVVGLRAAGYWQSVDVNAQTTPLGAINSE